MVDSAEARGEANKPKRAMQTFEMIFKIAEVTAGRVTPTDIDEFLRHSGPMAKTLSDQGIEDMAFLMDEQRKEGGSGS